jgi:UPF0755 protein
MPPTLRRFLVPSLVILALLGAGVGVGAWAVFAPNTQDFEGSRSIRVRSGAPFTTYVDSLESAGILRRRWSFDLVARAAGWEDQMKSGHYVFDAGRSNLEMLDVLRRGLQSPVRITLRSGTRADFMARAVAREMAFPADSFLAALRDPAFAAALGTDTTSLFAFMLPDTYFAYWEAPARTLIRKVKQSFDAWYAAEAARAPGPGMGLSPTEVLTVASIVEWETAHEPEMPTVAGVYLNRLRNRWRLQADPTIQYALIQLEGAKRRLFFSDYRLDHPYNTYLRGGLPPGPITNPSKAAIRSVLRPESHGYYFFVARGDGSHIFSRSLSEHRRNANAYLDLMRRQREEASRRAAEAAEGESATNR